MPARKNFYFLFVGEGTGPVMHFPKKKWMEIAKKVQIQREVSLLETRLIGII